MQRCIGVPAFHSLVLYGVSNNSRARWRNPDADLIGYVPQDGADWFAAEIEPSSPENDEPASAFRGGDLCATEFDGDAEAIDWRCQARWRFT
jgi:uronate dehydrogenase